MAPSSNIVGINAKKCYSFFAFKVRTFAASNSFQTKFYAYEKDDALFNVGLFRLAFGGTGGEVLARGLGDVMALIKSQNQTID